MGSTHGIHALALSAGAWKCSLPSYHLVAHYTPCHQANQISLELLRRICGTKADFLEVRHVIITWFPNGVSLWSYQSEFEICRSEKLELLFRNVDSFQRSFPNPFYMGELVLALSVLPNCTSGRATWLKEPDFAKHLGEMGCQGELKSQSVFVSCPRPEESNCESKSEPPDSYRSAHKVIKDLQGSCAQDSPSLFIKPPETSPSDSLEELAKVLHSLDTSETLVAPTSHSAYHRPAARSSYGGRVGLSDVRPAVGPPVNSPFSIDQPSPASSQSSRPSTDCPNAVPAPSTNPVDHVQPFRVPPLPPMERSPPRGPAGPGLKPAHQNHALPHLATRDVMKFHLFPIEADMLDLSQDPASGSDEDLDVAVAEVYSDEDDDTMNPDKYWAWDPDVQKYCHWDEEAQEMIHCPDEFD